MSTNPLAIEFKIITEKLTMSLVQEYRMTQAVALDHVTMAFLDMKFKDWGNVTREVRELRLTSYSNTKSVIERLDITAKRFDYLEETYENLDKWIEGEEVGNLKGLGTVIKNTAFSIEALKVIHEHAKFEYNQYVVWLKDATSASNTETALNHMKACETLVRLMEKVTTNRHGAGYNLEGYPTLKQRLDSFQETLNR